MHLLRCVPFVVLPFRPHLRDLTRLLQAEMVGHYLAEFAMTYKPTRHGRPGVGGNKFVPLK